MTATQQTAGHEKLPPLIPRMLNRVTAPKSGPAPMLRFHKWVYTATDGRIGPGVIGAWTLLLQTVGRRSGQCRTTALVFARDRQRLILAASNDGKDQAPAWFHNLCADPDVEVQIGREPILRDSIHHQRMRSRLSAVVGAHEPNQQQALRRLSVQDLSDHSPRRNRPIGRLILLCSNRERLRVLVVETGRNVRESPAPGVPFSHAQVRRTGAPGDGRNAAVLVLGTQRDEDVDVTVRVLGTGGTIAASLEGDAIEVAAGCRSLPGVAERAAVNGGA